MAGIQAMGTTFNLPNYHGELIALTPVDTPLLSMAGGLNGPHLAGDYEFEWQTYDLRAPQARPRLEGADAPPPEARVRENRSNLVQIFQESVSTSYTRQATIGRYAADSLNTDASAANPVRDEHAWQVQQTLVQIARDVNHVFWHSTYQKPTTNATARQTRGLLEAIQTNRVAASGAAVEDLATATDTITEASNGRTNGDKVLFTEATGAAADAVQTNGRTYYVVNAAAGTWKVSATPGGAPITLGTGTVSVAKAGDLTPDRINEWMQGIWTNGGISGQETSTLFISASAKRAFTKAWASQYSTDPFAGSRNVAGLNVTTVETDFGQLNLVLERELPNDTIALVDLAEVSPVFLDIPGKGVLFEEELAKTGAQEKTQIYGEIGLAYGNELHHGVITGLGV